MFPGKSRALVASHRIGIATDRGVGGRYATRASAGEIVMWGIRAVRVGIFLGGLLVTTAASGCCECCQCLWGTKSSPPATKSETQQDEQATPKGWKRGADSVPGGAEQPSHLTPERIKGGIY